MNLTTRLNKRSFLLLATGALVVIASITIFALTRGPKKVPHHPEKAVVHDNGLRIEFKPTSPGLEIVKSSIIGNGGEFVNLEAPARLIASTSPSVSSGSRIVLFESSELNDLYVGYIHAKNKVHRSRKNLNRIQDMFKHRVATEKDLVESETDVGNDAAELAEFEGKLRAVGLNPSELANAGNKKAWIICDVPESQINSLKRGKKVKVKFSSFPDEDWGGTAEAIGDNVDPYTRTAKVRIEIINKDYKLKPGMFGVVKFPEETAGDTVVLPFNSIVTVEGKNYVFVEEEPLNFVRREVTLGVSTKDLVNVIAGLTQGEKVVVQGSILLKGLSFGF
ncbi:efflux RND transporter periplasmic adaptor subunit [Leptospira ilyithenensis]|uniref:HlyD family efflux transporter periplasmic adaptor subunit n=1 Tax=Leptospira ilyithenensis TaxID=2484901 RepID=A0A4R9LN58_9LEPT|nr:efflux RND transporter periplasmic adaptor subunit [Leptospira ilyithenensis]TGN06882.1 HlyD family efflux transporter periplasmic adaptor subunit [Leptospira ilyithenensis]